ncbi:TPA: winged helix-turn-helix transcriptional regulator [Candidatus Bathyarchaeota archaeon]|nr:winged helix-turn-helix transcriptional regulator [Candidatus Bathyarchaeota archaeon]
MKILILLTRLGTLNVSEIAKRIGLNYSATDKHLKLLEAEGVLAERIYGRIRMFRFNETSPRAKAVQNLIEAWEQSKSKQLTNSFQRESK